ncbi:MAG: hypothetical protein Q8O95_00100 [bacterium]|nr:hypothetical protein [bacterium]
MTKKPEQNNAYSYEDYLSAFLENKPFPHGIKKLFPAAYLKEFADLLHHPLICELDALIAFENMDEDVFGEYLSSMPEHAEIKGQLIDLAVKMTQYISEDKLRGYVLRTFVSPGVKNKENLPFYRFFRALRSTDS